MSKSVGHVCAGNRTSWSVYVVITTDIRMFNKTETLVKYWRIAKIMGVEV